MRLLERINTPITVVVVLLAIVAVNAVLYFVYYLPGTSPVSTRDPVLAGAGDIAVCGSKDDDATAKLLGHMPDATIVTLGDNAYQNGTASDFANCYDPSWGRFKARTRPAAGNHEYYQTSDASGYFDYFGSAAGETKKGYYSYDRGAWHVIVLNSNCSQVGGCSVGSRQEKWLRDDLASHPTKCTLAYFHHPRFSSGSEHGNVTYMEPFWEALYEANADVVLSGHEHFYERFAPQDPEGEADPKKGIREFVVGTGGAPLYEYRSPKPNSQVRGADAHGVLKLTLHPYGYDWKFVPIAGESFTDSGTASCH